MKHALRYLALLLALGLPAAQAATLAEMVQKEGLVQGNPAMTTWVVKSTLRQRDTALFLSVWGKPDGAGQMRWGVIGQNTEDLSRPWPDREKARWLVKPEHAELVFMPTPIGNFVARIFVRETGAPTYSVIYQEYRKQKTHPTEFTQVYTVTNATPPERPDASQYRLGPETPHPALTRNLLAAYGKPDANGSAPLTLFESFGSVWTTLADTDADTAPVLVNGLLVVPYASSNSVGLIPTNLHKEGFDSPSTAKPLPQRYQAVGLHHGLIHAQSLEGEIQLLNAWGIPLDVGIGEVIGLPEPVAGMQAGKLKAFFVDLRLSDGRFARRLLIHKEDSPPNSLFPGKMPAGAGKAELGDMVFLGQGGSQNFFAAQQPDGSWDAFGVDDSGKAGHVQWAASSGKTGTVSTQGDPYGMLALLQQNNSLHQTDLRNAQAALRQDKPAFIRHVIQTARRDKFGYYQPISDLQLAERYAQELGGDLLGEWLVAFNGLSTMDENAIARLRAGVTDERVQQGLDRELANREQRRTNARISAAIQAEEQAKAERRHAQAARAAELMNRSYTGAPGLSSLEVDYYSNKDEYVIIRRKPK